MIRPHPCRMGGPRGSVRRLSKQGTFKMCKGKKYTGDHQTRGGINRRRQKYSIFRWPRN
jgi:hypothetical protein